jgi:phosphoglycerate dehydrogenase-like enzyme
VRVLIHTDIHPAALRFLEEEGFSWVKVDPADEEGARREAARCDGMVANAALEIGGAFFDLAPGLKVVGRQGVGVDNVDLEAASARGVRVVNTPGPVVEPVAEHTVMLLLAVARRLVAGDRAVRDGGWRTAATFPGPELAGKTLGIVGLGATGRRVAEIAVQGLRMRVIYHDLVARPEVERALGACRAASLEDLFAESDFVSVHVNLSPRTRGLIGARALARAKEGAILVNLSRGPVVDERALAEALTSGRLAGAGLDVFDPEPPARASPLLSLPNVVVTPHVGGASTESKLGCSMVVRDIVRVLRGEEPEHPVN